MTGLDQTTRWEIVAAALRAAGVPDPRPAPQARRAAR